MPLRSIECDACGLFQQAAQWCRHQRSWKRETGSLNIRNHWCQEPESSLFMDEFLLFAFLEVLVLIMNCHSPSGLLSSLLFPIRP